MTVALRYDAFRLFVRDEVPNEYVEQFERCLLISLNYIGSSRLVRTVVYHKLERQVIVYLKKSVNKPPTVIKEIIKEFNIVYSRIELLPESVPKGIVI